MVKAKRLVQIAVGLGSLVVGGKALAQSTVLMPPQDAYVGVRAYGMGGSYVAVADDGDAIFLNPAGIGYEGSEKSKSILRAASFPNFTVGMNKYTLGLYNEYKSGGTSPSEKVEKTMLASDGKDLVYGRMSAFPYLTIGRIQFGFLSDIQGVGYLNKYDEPQVSEYTSEEEPLTYDSKFDLYGRGQAGPVVGVSLPYRNAGIDLGVAARYTYRSTLYRSIEVSESVVRKASGSVLKSVKKTKGYAIDGGLLYSFGKKWKNSLGLSVRDIGDSKYVSRDGQYIEVEAMNIVAGYSVRPSMGKMMSSVFSVEGHRLNDSRVATLDKFSVGGEVGFFSTEPKDAPVVVRAGYNMRAVSYGISADLILCRLDFASSGEPVDGADGVRIDQRTFYRISVDLRT